MSYDDWKCTDTIAEDEAKRQALFDHYMDMVMTDYPYLTDEEAAGLADLMIGQKEEGWDEYDDWLDSLVYDSYNSDNI